MLYLIDGKVIYDSLNGTLRRINEKPFEATTLTTIAHKILTHLIQHHGELVTRDTLFDDIWEKEGIVSSSNTLNQYISLLRKTLTVYIGEQEAIVTVPRAGYYFSKNISVSENIVAHKSKTHWLRYVAAMSVLATIMSGVFVYLMQPEKNIPRKIGEFKGCAIYDISGVKSETMDTVNVDVVKKALAMNKQTCSQNTAFYIHAQEKLHLDKEARVLVSRCVEWPDSRDICQNMYYYSWVQG